MRWLLFGAAAGIAGYEMWEKNRDKIADLANQLAVGFSGGDAELRRATLPDNEHHG